MKVIYKIRANIDPTVTIGTARVIPNDAELPNGDWDVLCFIDPGASVRSGDHERGIVSTVQQINDAFGLPTNRSQLNDWHRRYYQGQPTPDVSRETPIEESPTRTEEQQRRALASVQLARIQEPTRTTMENYIGQMLNLHAEMPLKKFEIEEVKNSDENVEEPPEENTLGRVIE